MKLIDLHTHTFFSDGVLSPSELVYRYKISGCEAVALTDHVDYSNMEFVLQSMHKAAPKLRKYYEIEVIVGIELTYIPPKDIKNMIEIGRKMGAELVLVHGETSAENVPPGTNLAAVKARCDILVHPGYLTDEVAKTAFDKDVYIELTTRKGHSKTNSDVSESAIRNNCRIILNTDCHSPADLLDKEKIKKVLKQCNLEESYWEILRKNSLRLVETIKEKRK